jgi:3',5'-cyclic AMP phosphodiesterase CpdA
MKRLAWATDIHLNFLSPEGLERFCRSIVQAEPEALLLTGDIGEAASVERYLRALARRLERPIYFVLGNHDFYGGSIAEVRKRMAALTGEIEGLCWLTQAGVVELTPETGLLGHDSWADGRLGMGLRSPVILNDHLLVSELAWLDPAERFARLAALGDEAAAHFRELLPAALERYPRLLLLTHVPPYRESCLYESRVSGDDYLPHFTCKAVGDVLREAMAARPDRHLTVLCGHTHGAADVEILPNLRVITGGAHYGSPALQPEVRVA